MVKRLPVQRFLVPIREARAAGRPVYRLSLHLDDIDWGEVPVGAKQRRAGNKTGMTRGHCDLCQFPPPRGSANVVRLGCPPAFSRARGSFAEPGSRRRKTHLTRTGTKIRGGWSS